jgi:hypothetical protein
MADSFTPARPQRVRVRPGDSLAVVTWDSPDEGAPVTDYRLVPWSGRIPYNERQVRVDGSARSGQVRNLLNGTTYTVRVTPWNGDVEGPTAVSPTFEPTPAPGSPTGVEATAGERSATVSWTRPAGGGPVDSYRVRSSPSHGPPVEVSGAESTALIGDLHNRTRHTFTVAAVNGAGEGISSPSNPVWPGEDVPWYLFPLGFAYLLGLFMLAFLYALEYQPFNVDLPFLGQVIVPTLRDSIPARVAGVPVSVPWFGALGAVLIGLYGIFEHIHRDWDRRFTVWHVARPFTGAALGAVAFVGFAAVIRATGLNLGTQDPLGKGVSFALAFVVGFREQTFRNLIARVGDVVLGPGLALGAGLARGR